MHDSDDVYLQWEIEVLDRELLYSFLDRLSQRSCIWSLACLPECGDHARCILLNGCSELFYRADFCTLCICYSIFVELQSQVKNCVYHVHRVLLKNLVVKLLVIDLEFFDVHPYPFLHFYSFLLEFPFPAFRLFLLLFRPLSMAPIAVGFGRVRR